MVSLPIAFFTFLPENTNRKATGAQVWGQTGGAGSNEASGHCRQHVWGFLKLLTKSTCFETFLWSLDSASVSPPRK